MLNCMSVTFIRSTTPFHTPGLSNFSCFYFLPSFLVASFYLQLHLHLPIRLLSALFLLEPLGNVPVMFHLMLLFLKPQSFRPTLGTRETCTQGAQLGAL